MPGPPNQDQGHRGAVKGADKLILATDPDREGEAISWHVLEVLKSKNLKGKMPVERVVVQRHHQEAVTEAIQQSARDRPGAGRRLSGPPRLDYLVGFTLSPVLWRKLPGARSAGRVQSWRCASWWNARSEIEALQAQEYWSIDADCRLPAATFPDPAGATGRQEDRKAVDLTNQADADRAARRDQGGQSFSVASVEAKPGPRNPSRPSPPRPCSRKPAASSASRQAHHAGRAGPV
jgi:DNA topoisomerase-1